MVNSSAVQSNTVVLLLCVTLNETSVVLVEGREPSLAGPTVCASQFAKKYKLGLG